MTTQHRRGIIVALAAAALLAVVGRAAAQASDAAYQQFVFAYRLLQLGENKQAAEAFDDYLGKFLTDDKRSDALYYRAMLARSAGDNAMAARLLAMQAKPTKIVPDYAVNLLRGQVDIDLGQYDQALASLEKIALDNLDPAIRASALYMRGLAYRGAKNPAAAATNLAAVGKIDSPLKARALLDLARVQVMMDKPDDALASLNQCLDAKDPQVAPEAARLAGDLAYKAGRFKDAIDYYHVVQTQYQSSPHFGPAVIGVLWSRLSAKEYQALLQTFEQTKGALQPEDRVTAWYLAGSAQFELGKFQDAAVLLEAIVVGAAGSPIEDKVLFKLAACQYEMARYADMAQTVAKLKAKHPTSPFIADADFLLAAADAKQGQATRGAARLSIIITQGPQHPYFAKALLQRAKLYESTRKLEPAEADYQRYVKLAEATGGPELVPATLRLIDLKYRLSKFDEAATTAEQLLAKTKLDPLVEQEVMYRRALALIQLQKHQAAFDALNAMLSKHPQNRYLSEARYYRGLLAMGLKKPDEAVADLLAAVKSGELSDSLATNAWRLAAIRLREKKADDQAAEALAALEKIVGRARLTADEQVWLGHYYVAKNDPRAALRYLQPILEATDKVAGKARAEAFLLTGRCLRQLNDLKPAEQAFRQVVAMSLGFELEARLELAKTLAQDGMTDDALGEYAGLLSVKPSAIAAEALFDSAHIHRQTAATLKRASDPTGAAEANRKAFAMLKRLVVLYSFPQLAPMPQIGHIELAEVADELDQPAEAANAMRELAEKFPNGPYANYAKAMLAVQQNKRSDAVFLLKMLRQQDLDEPLAKRVKAQLTALEGTP